MRNVLYPLIIAASLPFIAHTVSAQVLFSDNFNGMTGPSGYPATSSTGANFELGNAGRIGGTLTLPAGANYVLGNTTDGSGNVNVQLGNPNTLPGDNLDNNVVGDNMLLAATAATWINYDFSAINGPVSLSFNGLVDSGNSTDWLSVMVGNPSQTSFVVNTTFGILFRANGGTQYFNNGNGTTGAAGVGPGANVWQSYQIVLSDTAGTGSAFAGNGSLITYYANGIKLGTASIGQLVAGQGYLGFGCPGAIAGIDRIVVAQSVPVSALPVLVQPISPANATVAVGSNVVFTAAFSNSPPVNLQWQKIVGGVTNNVNTGVVNATNSGVVTSTLTLNNVQLADSGAVYLMEAVNATNSAAVVYTSPASLTVVSPITWYAAGAGNGVFTTDAVLGFAGSVANEVYGVNFGVGPTTTGNGYSFDDYQNAGNMSIAGSITSNSGYLGSATTGDPYLDVILNNGISGSAANTGTLNNLTVGQAYTVLVMLDDTRTSGATGPNFKVTDGLTSSPTQQFAFPNGTTAVGGFIMGTFTAQATTQPLTVLQNGNAQYVAILLEKGTASAPIFAPTLTQDIRPLVSKVSTGAPVTLSVGAAGSSPIHYQWSGQSGQITGATNASYTFNALAGTNYYYVGVTNSAGGLVSSTAEVIASTNIVSVYNFSFEDGTTGSGNFVLPVLWTAFNNTDFSGVGNNNYTPNNPLAAPADGSEYFLINKGSGTGGIYQDVGPLLPNTAYTLTVAIGLRDDFGPGSANPGLGSPGIISLINGTNNAGIVLVSTNGVPNTPNTWQDFTISFTNASATGDLTVELSVLGASTIQANFDNVRLTKVPVVGAIAPVLVTDIKPLRSEVTTGTPLTFSVAVNGSPLNYQWYNGGVPIGAATTNSYSFNAVTGTNYYQVIVTNSAGSVTSSVATVISAPNIVTVNNYSFEDGSTPAYGNGAIPLMWTAFNGDWSGLGTGPGFSAPDGNLYFAINTGPGHAGASGVYQDVGALLPNTTYTLTVAIGRSSAAGVPPNGVGDWSPGIISLLNGTDNTGTLLSSTTGYPAAVGTWQDFTTSFSTGPSASGHLIVELSVAPANTWQGTFDNVRLTQGAAAPTAPIVGSPKVSGGNLILTGSGGTPNAVYTLLTTTNLALPVANWATNSTGMLDGTGAFSNAIPISTSQSDSFFRLRLP